MEAAYLRLSQTLGSEVMQFLEHTEVRVYKKDQKEVRGSVGFGNPTFKLNSKLKPELQNDSLGTIELSIGEISEPNIAHEFAHLFAQSSYFLSEAFSDGMVYGLINYLYPNYYNSMPDFHIRVVRQKCVATLFEKGWDYDGVDTGFGGGLDEGLAKLVHSQWAIIWADFIAEHPEFPKRFFNLVLEERKKGKLDFSRDELWDMAKHAEPDFEQWHTSKGASIRPIEAQTAFYMVVTGPAQVSVFNFTANQTDISDGRLHAGSIKQTRNGQSSLLDPDGKIKGDIPITSFVRIDIPNIPAIQSHSIIVEGTKVPFLDSATCKEKR
jgi:hypothetical protein